MEAKYNQDALSSTPVDVSALETDSSIVYKELKEAFCDRLFSLAEDAYAEYEDA